MACWNVDYAYAHLVFCGKRSEILIILLVIIFPLDIIVAVTTTLNNKPALQKIRQKIQKQPPEVFYKKNAPKNFTKFTGKKTLAQMFSCEFWEFFKSTFFTEHLWTTASEKKNFFWDYQDIALKMKFSVKDFFSRCNQICSFLRLWSRLLKKSLIENSIFYAVGISGINLFSQISQPTSKVNIGKTRTTSETCSKLIKIPEKCHWHHWSIYFTTQKVKFFNFSFLHSAFSRDLFSHFWGKKSFKLSCRLLGESLENFHLC